MVDGMEVKVGKTVKACPLCGSRKNLVITSKDFYVHHLETPPTFGAWIKCDECDLTMWHFDYGDTAMSYEDIIKNTVKKWNGRATHHTEKKRITEKAVGR